MAEQRVLKRILIGGASFSDAGSALAIVERMAGTMVSDIGGMLLEDRSILETGAAVSGAIVSSAGDLREIPDADALRHLLEGDAKAFRNRLRRFAEANDWRWSFERRSGETISGLCAAAGDWDWLLIGHARIARRGGSIVAVAPGDAGQSELPGLAEALSGTLRTQTIWVEPSLGEDEFFGRINAASADLVVIDAAHGPVCTVGQIRRLYMAARCPVLVLSASGIRPQVTHWTKSQLAGDAPSASGEDGGGS